MNCSKTKLRHVQTARVHPTRRLALALAVILLLLLAACRVRPLEFQINNGEGTWFNFITPGTQSNMRISGFEAFTPYFPQYLPEGFDGSVLGTTATPDFDRLELIYSNYPNGQLFVTLLQTKSASIDELPQGDNINVEGKVGVFVQDFATSIEQLQQKIPSIPIVRNLDYSGTGLLAWHIGEIKIELLSNLPKEEILKIATSVSPVESEVGEIPPDQKP